MSTVLVTPRALKSDSHPALAILRDAGYRLVIPSPGVLPDADTLKKTLPDCVAWLAGVEKITADILDAAPNLRIISRNGVGMDNVDLKAAEDRGITVVNTPGANARGVAELALALILSIARSIPATDLSIKTGGWHRRQGIELEGKTLGIIGCGQIGKILTGLGAAMGMQVLGYDLYPDASFSPPGFRYADAHEIARLADVISVHVPGCGKPFIDADFLAEMKNGAILVNTARASVADEAAVLAALESGKLRGYGVDAFDPEPPGATPLTTHPGVVCTSHIGGYTDESVARAAERAAQNIIDALR